MIQKFLSNTEMIWMIFVKLLNIIIQIKEKVMIVFDDMVADIFGNKELNPTVTELFTRGRKLNISIVFIKQAYFGVPKNIRQNSTHIFVMTIPSKRKIQQIAFNQSSDIDIQDVMRPCKKCTAKSYSFFIIDTTLASDTSSRFRNNLSKKYKN